MKKTTLLFVLILLAFSVNAQTNYTYNFSATNENYADLTNNTSLNNGNYWDDPDFTIPFGFDFEIAGKTFSKIYFSEDIANGGIVSDKQSYSSTNLTAFGLSIQDLEDRGTEDPNSSLSNISYTVEGTPGNRIFKLEWNNAGFWEDGTEQDFINMQLWLYEGSNIIEYHYGPHSIANPAESYEGLGAPAILFLPSLNGSTDVLNSDGYALSGNPANPTLEVIDAGSSLDNPIILDDDIPNGTVYRFTPENLSNKSFQLAAISLYPNPVAGELHLKTDIAISSVSIYNALGQVITESFEIEKNTIDVSTLAEGIYFIKMETENGTSSTKKFIKK